MLFATVLPPAGHRDRRDRVAGRSDGASQEGGALPLFGQVMSSSVVSALPVVVLYLIFQRYLVGGLTVGGVK